ncbi:MAG TPA: hypothetical protein VEN82_06480 [Actinomycetota bacterium]|nr:hypothetical protein [Actinomycetota bacterium]
MVRVAKDLTPDLDPAAGSNQAADPGFTVSRRGFDPAEVRHHVRQLGVRIARLESELADERSRAATLESRAEEAERQAQEAAHVDLTRRLGEVLRALDEAVQRTGTGAEQQARALLDASRVQSDRAVSDAMAEAQSIVAAAQAEAERIRSDARDVAHRTLEQATITADQTRREAVGDADRAMKRAAADAELVRAEAAADADRFRGEAAADGDRIRTAAASDGERVRSDAAAAAELSRQQAARSGRTIEEARVEAERVLVDARAAAERTVEEARSNAASLLGDADAVLRDAEARAQRVVEVANAAAREAAEAAAREAAEAAAKVLPPPEPEPSRVDVPTFEPFPAIDLSDSVEEFDSVDRQLEDLRRSIWEADPTFSPPVTFAQLPTAQAPSDVPPEAPLAHAPTIPPGLRSNGSMLDEFVFATPERHSELEVSLGDLFGDFDGFLEDPFDEHR